MSVQLGFHRSTWNNYETGSSNPALKDFIIISKYFGIPETDLLHVDLEKIGATGNLISEQSGKQKGNLKGNLTGNLSAKTDENEGEKSGILRHMMPQVVTVDTKGDENIVMVPVRARAGYLHGYDDPSFIEDLPVYSLPGLSHGTYRLFEVEGISMYPTLHSGDLIIGSFVERLIDVRDDRVYVVVTRNDGLVVKRVLNRIEKDGKLILKSDNHKERDMYPPIVCDPEDILEIWYATGNMSRQLRPPDATHNRVIDLEGRLTLMEDFYKRNFGGINPK